MEVFRMLAWDYLFVLYLTSSVESGLEEIGIHQRLLMVAATTCFYLPASKIEGRWVFKGFLTTYIDKSLNLHIFGDFED